LAVDTVGKMGLYPSYGTLVFLVLYGWGGMRVLIAMEEDHQLYRDVLAGSLKAMRPPLEVATAAPEDFEECLESFEPHVVICDGQNFARSEGPLAWIDLPFDPTRPLQRPAQFWVEGRCREIPNPDLQNLLSMIDEVALARYSGRRV
jgi:hypothetical protein